MHARFYPNLVMIFTLTACSHFPELDGTVDSAARDAAYPDLIPVEQIYARMPDARIEPDTSLEVEARVDRLRSRAARLRGTVIDSATRHRMKVGVN